MEKTIEERANDAYAFCETERENAKGRENTGGWYFPSVYRSGYIKGATEQKDIDDKVAFEEREKAFMAGCHTAIEKAKEAFNKACGWLAVYPWYNGVFEEFVKAIEE